MGPPAIHIGLNTATPTIQRSSRPETVRPSFHRTRTAASDTGPEEPEVHPPDGDDLHLDTPNAKGPVDRRAQPRVAHPAQTEGPLRVPATPELPQQSVAGHGQRL